MRALRTISMMTLAALFLAVSAAPAAAQGAEEQAQLYQRIGEAEVPSETIRLAEEFLARFPESTRRIAVAGQALQAAGELDPDGQLTIAWAQTYLTEYRKRTPPYNAFNSAAWQLFQMDAQLDMAAAWADSALAAIPSGAPGRVYAMVEDTKANVAFARGDKEKAVEVIRSAVEHDPGNAEYKITLGRFLSATGKHQEAMDLLVEGLIGSPSDEQALEAVRMSAETLAGSTAGGADLLAEAFGEAEQQMLSEAEDLAATKQRLAAAYATLGVRTDRALELARDAASGVSAEDGADALLQSRTTLAMAQAANQQYEEALETLDQVETLASPYATPFHVTRGDALRALGQDQAAIQAYMAGATAYPNPEVMNKLEALWEQTYGTSRDLQAALDAKAQELRDWHPEGTFTPGEAWQGRTVLAELFTGSECPPCVASDLAYDGILAYYPPEVVAVLEYHLHIPGPDPMTNEDAEARQAYYEGAIRGTPTSIVNGTDISVGGGPDVAAKSRFGLYQWSIDEAMKGAPPVAIDLSGTLDGQTVTMEAAVEWTAQPMEGDYRLRVGLAEKEVHYTGANGVSEHKMVVRKLLGGPDGWSVEGMGTTTASATADIAALEQQLLDYLTAFEEQNPNRFRGSDGFSAKKHAIDEGELVLVAFVQNDATKEVVEAKVFELK